MTSAQNGLRLLTAFAMPSSYACASVGGHYCSANNAQAAATSIPQQRQTVAPKMQVYSEFTTTVYAQPGVLMIVDDGCENEHVGVNSYADDGNYGLASTGGVSGDGGASVVYGQAPPPNIVVTHQVS